MKKLFIFWIPFLFLVTLCKMLNAQDNEDKTKSEEFERTKQLIVMINADMDGSEEFGAGIIVGLKKDELLIATAYHLLHNGREQSNKIQVKFKSKPDKFFEAHILKYSNEDTMDLALIGVKYLPNTDSFPVKLNTSVEASSIKPGDKVFALGNPNGSEWAMPVNPDKVSDILGNDISFQSSFITRGNSGGGLLDENGGIAGLITADQPPFGRAINIDSIIRKINHWGYPVQLLVMYENGLPPLHNAARNGDIASIKNLLSNDLVNVNQRDHRQSTPLHYAAAYANTEVVKLLINAGADLNALDEDGDPPVEWALETGRTETVKLLVDAGAKTETKNFSGKSLLGGWTPLIVAVIEMDIIAIKNILAKGANINQADDQKATPLHYAAAYADTGVISLLINAGARIKALDKKDNQPVIWAAEAGKIQNLEYLIKKESIDIGDKEVNSFGKSLLDAATKNGQIDIAKFLLKSGVDINGKFELEPPIVTAAKHNQYPMIEFLLKTGANVNLTGSFHRTALFYSVVSGYFEIIKLLIRSGADVNIKDDEFGAQFSPLQILFQMKLQPGVVFESLKILVASGADVNAKGDNELRPLNYAMLNGYNASAEFLIAHGAIK